MPVLAPARVRGGTGIRRRRAASLCYAFFAFDLMTRILLGIGRAGSGLRPLGGVLATRVAIVSAMGLPARVETATHAARSRLRVGSSISGAPRS